MINLRANASIIVTFGSLRYGPTHQAAVGLKPQQSPRQLDQYLPHALVAEAGKPFLSAGAPLSSGEPVIPA
jgi:hypothetical protein